MNNRIQSIQLNNFKFFQDTDNLIRLNGDNLLLYGENGSGKSSIYWAFYTLFESALKIDDREIRKYFCKNIKLKDNLVNIHAIEDPAGSDAYNSFIELITTDNPTQTFRISKTDVAINTSMAAKTTNYASDFINYRLLQSLSSFYHSDDIDLHGMFAEGIFKYVQFDKVQITRDGKPMEFTNAFDIWNQILKGQEMVPKRGNPAMKLRAYKFSAEWHEFENLVRSFNTSLQKLIDYINVQAPRHFKELGYDFSFSLQLEKGAYYWKGDKNYEYRPFILRVKIPTYAGVIDAIHKPHSFLNEAKLSALAIAIRLAILTEKRQENCLKFIILDDLLISLDMRNREKVLDLLLSPEFIDHYQLLILTHDRMFFQMAKHKINILEQSNWKYIEMYETEDGKGHTKPHVKSSKTYYEKAVEFYSSNNLPEAANNLRKAGEEFCKKVLSKKQTISEDYTAFDLNGMIEHCLLFATSNDLQQDPFQQLDKFRKFLLNAGSHDDYDTPLFKNEINDCIEIFDTYFNKVKIKHIIPVGTELFFELTDGKKSEVYRFEIILRENLRIYQEPTKGLSLLKVKITYKLLKDGTLLTEQNDFVSLQKLYEKPYNTSDKTKSVDYLKEIRLSANNQQLETVVKF